MTQDCSNEWIPVQWLPISNVFIVKRSTGYESTDDSGETWRQSTEGEIAESSWNDDRRN